MLKIIAVATNNSVNCHHRNAQSQMPSSISIPFNFHCCPQTPSPSIYVSAVFLFSMVDRRHLRHRPMASPLSILSTTFHHRNHLPRPPSSSIAATATTHRPSHSIAIHIRHRYRYRYQIKALSPRYQSCYCRLKWPHRCKAFPSKLINAAAAVRFHRRYPLLTLK